MSIFASRISPFLLRTNLIPLCSMTSFPVSRLRRIPLVSLVMTPLSVAAALAPLPRPNAVTLETASIAIPPIAAVPSRSEVALTVSLPFASSLVNARSNTPRESSNVPPVVVRVPTCPPIIGSNVPWYARRPTGVAKSATLSTKPSAVSVAVAHQGRSFSPVVWSIL